jgi:hypothetical protein
MAYTHTTFSAMKVALSQRLGDTGMVYWVDAELGEYIKEALQTWGLITGYWRDSGTFTTVSGTALYDISTLQNTLAVDLLSYAVTDTTLATVIQYHLLEPATGTTWTGSEQFTLADVTGALTRRRDTLLLDGEVRITHSTQVLGAGSQTVDLSEDIQLIRRMAWTSSGSVTYPIYPEDIDSQRNYSTSFLTTQGIPATYSYSTAIPSRYVIAPPPNQPGTLDLLTINSGASLTAQGIAVGVPDDMCWIVKWGALADMLGREGPGQDLARSYFCERRYRLGVELAKVYPTVINAQIDGISLSPDAITNFDRYNMNWQSTTGSPEFVGSLRNYIALSTCPNGVYSVLLDVVRKAPLPSASGSFIEVGKEYLNTILDYAEHLAAFKCGGEEFRHTLRAADSFFNTALSYNQRLAAQHPALVTLIRQSTEDFYTNPTQKNTGNRVLMARANASEESQ